MVLRGGRGRQEFEQRSGCCFSFFSLEHFELRCSALIVALLGLEQPSLDAPTRSSSRNGAPDMLAFASTTEVQQSPDHVLWLCSVKSVQALYSVFFLFFHKSWT